MTISFLAVEELSYGGGADDFTTLASGSWATLLTTVAEHAVALRQHRTTDLLSSSSERAIDGLPTQSGPIERLHQLLTMVHLIEA
jgi:hypothetical protein